MGTCSQAERKESRYVIVNVGKGKVCNGVGIQYRNGQEALGIGGTTEREDIGEIVDYWNLDRVRNAEQKKC